MTMIYLQMTMKYITMMLIYYVNGDVVDDDIDNDSVNEFVFIDDHAYTHGSVSLPL